MRALFVLKHPGVVRNLESTLRLLADRGHELRLAFENTKTGESIELVRRLEVELPGFAMIDPPALSRNAPFATLVELLRRSIDYLRYLEPRYARAEALRARAERAAPVHLRAAARLPLARRPLAVAAARRLLQAVERSLPARPEVAAFVAAQEPDVVLVAPLVGIASRQADYLRAAQRMGIRTAFQVLSWDNLTNKGLLRDVPDVTIVWNEAQATEAEDLHGLPRSRIVVSGAATYDHWFEWRPGRTRDELCDQIGLRRDRPFVLYVCSSPFIAPEETGFVGRWIESLRSAGGALAEVGVLIRPHPQNAAQWHGYAAPEQVAVWPRGGEDPLEERSRRNYFDSIHHCSAVVGINTSALIESAVVGRPVLTILDPAFAGTQEGTLHFQHLAADGSGPLYVAASPEEHRSQLADALAGRLDARGRDARFVRSFVRPHGLAEAAAPRVVDAIERLVAAPAPPPGEPLAGALLRPLLRPFDRALAARARKARRTRRRAQAVEMAGVAQERLESLRAIAAGHDSVVCGPWLGSIASELLYWIPFLRWCCTQEPGLADRLVAVSSGGVCSWYADLAKAGYVDLLDHVDVDDLRNVIEARAERGGMPVHRAGDGADDHLLRLALAERLAESPVLRPEAMFDPGRSIRKQQSAMRVAGMLPLARIDAFDSADLETTLPAEYVAVQLAFGPAFPETAENRRAVAEVLRELARRRPLVAIDGGFRSGGGGRVEAGVDVLVLGDGPAERSLAVRTDVLARASGFVATYGGLCHLGPLLGVPTVALYAEPDRFRRHHLAAERALAAHEDLGSFVAVSAARDDCVESVLGALPQLAAPASSVPFP